MLKAGDVEVDHVYGVDVLANGTTEITFIHSGKARTAWAENDTSCTSWTAGTCCRRAAAPAPGAAATDGVLSAQQRAHLERSLYPQALAQAGELDSPRNREIAASDYWLFLQRGGGSDAEAQAALMRGLRSCDAAARAGPDRRRGVLAPAVSSLIRYPVTSRHGAGPRRDRPAGSARACAVRQA